MLQPPSTARFSEDGITCDFVEGAWKPPVSVDPKFRQEARDQFDYMSQLAAPAGQQLPYLWLLSLTKLLKIPNMDMTTALEKFRAYASLLGERPAFCFTQAALGAAARKFDWFPSFKEVDDFLADEEKRNRADMHRLGEIANGKNDPNAPMVKPWSREVGDQRKIDIGSHVTRELQELIDIVDERDRQSGWAAKDPRPIVPPLPHDDVHPSLRTREQEIDRIKVLSAHRKVCEAWGNRMRERDLAALTAAKKGKAHV